MEPATIVLGGLGALGLAVLASKKKKPPAPPVEGHTTIDVRVAQTLLARLGQKLTIDGKLGPVTAQAWVAEAKARSLAILIVGPTGGPSAEVDTKTAKALASAAAAAPELVVPPKPKPAPVVTPDADREAALRAAKEAKAREARAEEQPAQPTQPTQPAQPLPRHEQLNNAISRIDFLTPKAPAGTRKAVTDLATHWLNEFWNKGYRNEPAKLDAYGKWYTRAWKLVPKAVQAKCPHPTLVDPSYAASAYEAATPSTPTPAKPAPAPAPASAETITIPTLRAQQITTRHGATLQLDGVYGPNTRAAWEKLATTHHVSSRFEKASADGKQTRVDAQSLRKLDALPTSGAAQAPVGYDRVKAKARAKEISAALRKSGKAYDRKLLAGWQTQAGLKADGLYGPISRNALVYYGATDAPAAYVAGENRPYTPPA
jgi:peptidoglycan hydrolase-like protein with peptidoglycan-binding domain